MEGLDHSCPEDRLFDALREIFKLEPKLALSISKQAVEHIATYVADLGAISKNGHMIEQALKQIEDMGTEINTLKAHLLEYELLKSNTTFH